MVLRSAIPAGANDELEYYTDSTPTPPPMAAATWSSPPRRPMERSNATTARAKHLGAPAEQDRLQGAYGRIEARIKVRVARAFGRRSGCSVPISIR